MASFSIILPVRNGGHYVKECIASLLGQSFENFNVIVLDNCSTDDTVAWIRSLNDNRLNVHESGNALSIEQNWARIKNVPKNEFMTMIGYDDLLHSNYLQEMDALIRKHPTATLYQGHFDYIDAKGRFIRDCLRMDEIQLAHEFLASQMTRKIDSTGTGYMMRSLDFDAVGGMPVQYPNLIFSDYELWIKLMMKGYKATSPKKCFSYRIHKSVSRTTNGMAYQEAFSQYLQFLLTIMESNTLIVETVRKYGSEFLLYYCESLSHRLLKTPVKERTLTVSDFIKKCELFSAKLIPGQEFKPLNHFRIRIASQLDQSFLGRKAFALYKKLW